MSLNTKYNYRLNTLLDLLYLVFSLACFSVLFLRVFFFVPIDWLPTLSLISHASIVVFTFQEVIRFLIVKNIKKHFKNRKFELSIVLLILVYIVFKELVGGQSPLPLLSPTDFSLFYLGSTGLITLISFLAKKIKSSNLTSSIKLSTNNVFILSFLGAIVIGTILLKLPRSTINPISWTDALFTATSAVCVTGLSTLDISQSFSFVGLTVILVLFQIGGLGIMTITMLFASFFTGSLALGEIIMLKDFFKTENINEATKMFKRVALYTFSFELLGFLSLLLFRLYNDSPFNKELIFESIFHSISAFCNAGFSLFSKSLNSEQVFQNYGYINTIMILVVIGGLGFPVITNIIESFRSKKTLFKRRVYLTTHTKLVLSSTLALLIFGFAGLFLLESGKSFNSITYFDKAYQSLFLTVTSRTAGFNLWPTESLGLSTMSLICFLMWVGAAPISTGGGIKCTTLAISISHIFNHFRRKDRCELFEREISPLTIYRSFTAVFASLMLISIIFIALIELNPEILPGDLLFETFSAFGTVGLSRGATSQLSEVSKYLIVALMFCGRVGLITVFSALFRPHKMNKKRYLTDDITVY